MKGISIVMCCYNSALRLEETFTYLASLIIPDSYPVELVLVDNASTDDTSQKAKGKWQKAKEPFELKVISEPLPGKTKALSRGVHEAQYDVVVFCDDDNWLQADYLIKALTILDKYPEIGAVGGNSILVSWSSTGSYSTNLPDWFEKYQSVYACGKQADKSGICTSRMYLWGAGLVSRKDILQKVYHKDYPPVSVGRSKESLSSGEDVELCMRIVLQGYELYYSEDLVFQHAIDQKRLNEEYRDRLVQGVARFTEIKRLYSHRVYVTRSMKILIPVVYFMQLVLYGLLKLKVIRKQKYAIINPLKVWFEGVRVNGRFHSEYLRIKEFAIYASGRI